MSTSILVVDDDQTLRSLIQELLEAEAYTVDTAIFSLIRGQRSISGSPTGSPLVLAEMLKFAARYHIAPQVEHSNMSQVNEAFTRLRSGKARYRIVLEADFEEVNMRISDQQ